LDSYQTKIDYNDHRMNYDKQHTDFNKIKRINLEIENYVCLTDDVGV